MDLIQQNDKVLLLWDQSFDPTSINTDEVKSSKNVVINFENSERLTLGECETKKNQSEVHPNENVSRFCLCAAAYPNSSFNLVILKTKTESGIEFLASLLKLLKPQGRIVVAASNVDSAVENLKLAGFVKTTVNNGGE